MRFSYRILCLHFLCGTRKEVCMEVREVASFHYSRIKFVTLEELGHYLVESCFHQKFPKWYAGGRVITITHYTN